MCMEVCTCRHAHMCVYSCMGAGSVLQEQVMLLLSSLMRSFAGFSAC